MAGLVIASGLGTAMFGQQYPGRDAQQYPASQPGPRYNGQHPNGQGDNGQYGKERRQVGGYLMCPPYVGGYWAAPRYSGAGRHTS
jgi:hypothetical protein